MVALVRETKTYRLLTVYRYVAFDLPKMTTAVGIIMLSGLLATQLYILGTEPAVPWYLSGYIGLLTVGCLVAAVVMTLGRRRLTRHGWRLGTLISMIFLAGYLLSRVTGLPSLPRVQHWWDYPPGTLGLVFAGLFIGLHVSVLLGMNIAYPQKRHWHD